MKLSVNKARKIWWTVSVIVILIGLIAGNFLAAGYTLRPSLISSAVLGYSLNWLLSTAELRSPDCSGRSSEVMVDQD